MLNVASGLSVNCYEGHFNSVVNGEQALILIWRYTQVSQQQGFSPLVNDTNLRFVFSSLFNKTLFCRFVRGG